MYTQSLGQVRESFWKTYGRYMAPVPSAAGGKINWINYKTGIKSVRITLDLDEQKAEIALSVSDAVFFSGSIAPLRKLFETTAGTDWNWENGRISAELKDKSIRRSEDWPELIAFFKQRLTALDKFWQEVRGALE